MPRLSKAEKERCHREILEMEQAKIKPYLDRIAGLEKKNKVLTQNLEDTEIINKALEKENAKLRKVAEFQQSSNMNTHLENKKIKEVLAVGSMWNKHLNSQNKALEEERDKYRDMTFEQREQLTKAKDLLKWFVWYFREGSPNLVPYKHKVEEAEQFLSEVEK